MTIHRRLLRARASGLPAAAALLLPKPAIVRRESIMRLSTGAAPLAWSEPASVNVSARLVEVDASWLAKDGLVVKSASSADENAIVEWVNRQCQAALEKVLVFGSTAPLPRRDLLYNTETLNRITAAMNALPAPQWREDWSADGKHYTVRAR